MKNTTKVQNLPFATDEECKQLRQKLILAGKIVPAKRVAERTTKEHHVPAPKRRNAYEIPEEGIYRVRRIRNDEEYEKRKNNYFIMLQSILRSRIELDLEFDGGRDAEEPNERI